MINLNADPRNGALANGGACETCCCEKIGMRLGETNLVEINYAPWSLPIGGGLVNGSFKYHVETNSDACDAAFAAPNQTLVTALDTPLVIDVDANVDVAGAYTYNVLPLSDPENGVLDTTGADIVYTPNSGFEGYDYFAYELTDASGATDVVVVEINVGTHRQLASLNRMATVPYISRSSVQITPHTHVVRFPLFMPRTCTPCETHRITLSVKARDCNNNTYEHFTCLDITCKDC